MQTQPTEAAAAPAFTEKAFDILRHAVTLARNTRVTSVGVLRSRLLEAYPQNPGDVDAALNEWAHHAAQSEARVSSH